MSFPVPLGAVAVTTPSLSPVPFVVLDACVLMSGIMRRLMLRLAADGVYQPVWTERIGEEWRRNAARLWAIPPEVLQEQWAAMNQLFPQATELDTQAYEAGLRYSDPKDFHVIAAGLARRARCGLQQPPQVLVATWNLKDFNRSELRRQGLDALNPDRLLSLWWQADAGRLRQAIQAVPADYIALGRDPEPLAATLHRERLYRLKALVARDAPQAR
nr:PIN domain-containing protein [Bordetella sp. BOR01]